MYSTVHEKLYAMVAIKYSFFILQLQTLFRPGRAYNSKLSQAIKALTKLSLMKERLENFKRAGLYTSVINTLFTRVATDACQWVSKLKYILYEIVLNFTGHCTIFTLTHSLTHSLSLSLSPSLPPSLSLPPFSLFSL